MVHVLMGYLRDHVNVCFLEPEDPSESILSNVRIESQVGDEQKQAVLKNVGKIERFVLEQMRKFITEDFVYPSYHSVKLERAAPPPPPPPPPLSSSSSPPPQQSSSTSSLTANSTYTRTDNHGTRTAMTSNSPNMANSIATAPPSVTSRSSSSTGTSMITGAVGGGGGGVGGGEGYSTSVRPRPNTPSSVTYQRHY
ncbi:Mitochondrial distribution and morphology protein 12 [Podila humilis]|nr:Mitochondrial distribution and morphology protein 12 [Podila humilis]